MQKHKLTRYVGHESFLFYFHAGFVIWVYEKCVASEVSPRYDGWELLLVTWVVAQLIEACIAKLMKYLCWQSVHKNSA